MAHGHKFAKLKPANCKNFAIHQNFYPQKSPTIQYIISSTLLVYTLFPGGPEGPVAPGGPLSPSTPSPPGIPGVPGSPCMYT